VSSAGGGWLVLCLSRTWRALLDPAKRNTVHQLSTDYQAVFWNYPDALACLLRCSEQWPHCDARLYEAVPGATTLGEARVRLRAHDRPRLACGCIRSRPVCSLAHAVAVGADGPADLLEPP
jgi:hypothetical protein